MSGRQYSRQRSRSPLPKRRLSGNFAVSPKGVSSFFKGKLGADVHDNVFINMLDPLDFLKTYTHGSRIDKKSFELYRRKDLLVPYLVYGGFHKVALTYIKSIKNKKNREKLLHDFEAASIIGRNQDALDLVHPFSSDEYKDWWFDFSDPYMKQVHRYPTEHARKPIFDRLSDPNFLVPYNTRLYDVRRDKNYMDYETAMDVDLTDYSETDEFGEHLETYNKNREHLFE